MTGYFESADKGSTKPDRKDRNWENFESLYNRNYLASKDNRIRIPRKIHQIWLGSKYPKQYELFLDEWRKHHQGWEVNVWTDTDVSRINLSNRKLFESVRNPGLKSDILRYEILYQFGGVYVDTDFFCLKSLDDLLFLELFAGSGHVKNATLFNGLIGCVPESITMRAAIDAIREASLPIDEGNHESIMQISGPYLFTKVFLETAHKCRAVAFPTTFFYPFPAAERSKIRGRFDEFAKAIVMKYVQSETYCIHLWDTSWQG